MGAWTSQTVKFKWKPTHGETSLYEQTQEALLQSVSGSRQMKKEEIKIALHRYLEGQLSKHNTNFQLLIETPRPIPEHTDFIDAAISELSEIAKYEELICALEYHGE